MHKFFISLLLLSVVFAGCKKKDTGGGGNPAPAQLFQYRILPSATNPAIVNFNSQHYVYFDTRVISKNKLFVFLPGTSGAPANYSLLLTAAAGMGFHSLGLTYPNNSDLYTVAATGTDLSLFGKGRQEIFDGTDQVSGISVDNNNCIRTRLVKLLQYLNTTYPAQNWSQYLNGSNDVQWSKIVIAGHSQGGGHALYIAKQVLTDRAVSFASIDWNTQLNAGATWVSLPGATPVNKMYSINHIGDEIFSYANVQVQLAAMGFTGPPVNVDNTASPYSNSHTLTSNYSSALPLAKHSMTTLDLYLPKAGNGNVIDAYLNAWEYLFGK